MTHDPTPDDSANVMQLRRCILQCLYHRFQDHPYAVIELSVVESECRTDVKTLNWNMVYLEKCGYVELGKSIESPPYIASSVTLTAAGIDLVESPTEFHRRFSISKPDEQGG